VNAHVILIMMIAIMVMVCVFQRHSKQSCETKRVITIIVAVFFVLAAAINVSNFLPSTLRVPFPATCSNRPSGCQELCLGGCMQRSSSGASHIHVFNFSVFMFSCQYDLECRVVTSHVCYRGLWKQHASSGAGYESLSSSLMWDIHYKALMPSVDLLGH
jgi:hypothetical protein